MGFAPFFDRARQSVGQALGGLAEADLADRLEAVVATIAFDAAAERSIEGRHTLDLSVALAARLYPRLRVLPLHGDRDFAGHLVALARSINPDIAIEASPDGTREFALVVGSTRLDGRDAIYVGSDGWVAKASTAGPVGSGGGGIPFGAGAAACIGMANVFRAVFADRLQNAAQDVDATLSLFNFETGASAANAPSTMTTDIGAVQLLGVGAVGNAFVWSLARVPEITGTLHPVDHETVELSNLQRYVLTTIDDENAVKVSLAQRELAGTKLKVVPAQATWAEHAKRNDGARFDLVAVALDSARDRVEVQSALPRRIVNGWTQDGDLGVSRHGFDGEEACMACLYLPRGKRRSLDEIVAAELGVDHATHKMRLREMLFHGTPVGEAFAREVAAAKNIDPTSLLEHSELPLRAFRQRAVCGGLVMRAGDGGGADVEVPLAFQSTLAGIMLAAEVVAERTRLRAGRPGTRSVINLLRPLPARPTSSVLKGVSPSASCICEDPDWQDAYAAKWSSSAAHAADAGLEPAPSRNDRPRKRKSVR